MRLALEVSPAAIVPCHNDPWPANLLDADGRIYLIDWEYSGMNDPMWDLADLSVEAGFGPEQDRTMMEVYYGARLSPELYSRLEEETGLTTGYRVCGGLTVARTPERMVQLRRTVGSAVPPAKI